MLDECRRKRQILQRRAVNNDEISEVPSIVHEVLRTPGQPLDPETRAIFEPRFGHDFSQVRVHTDTKAAESTKAVNALAYTVGNDIVFRDRALAHETVSARQLVAHELAHVVQQTGASAGTRSDLRISSAFEGEVEACSREIMNNAQTCSVAARTTSNVLLRKGDVPEFPAEMRPGRGGGEIADIVHDIRKKREEGSLKLSEKYRSHLLKLAGFKGAKTISTPEQALAILNLLKVDLTKLDERVKNIREATKGKIRGPTTSEDINKKSEDAVKSLSSTGKATFRKALEEVGREAFLEDFLLTGRVTLIPDDSACVRYGGYTKAGKEAEPITGAREAQRNVFLVYLCKKTIESGDVEGVRAIMAHELSHGFEKEFAGERAATLITRPLLKEIADQLAKLPKYKGLEESLAIFLYEELGGYPEAEIFANLQELPHHPKILEKDRLLANVICELRRVDAARFPENIRNVLIDELKLRTEFFYDERIRAESGAESKRLKTSKEYALKTLELAISTRELEREGEYPFEVHCGE